MRITRNLLASVFTASTALRGSINIHFSQKALPSSLQHYGAMSEVPVRYIERTDLLSLVRSKQVTIVDVRNDDFVGGHIPSAINIPYGDEWETDEFLDEVVEKVKSRGHSQIVFHCMKSQQRGPYCARQFARRLENREEKTNHEM